MPAYTLSLMWSSTSAHSGAASASARTMLASTAAAPTNWPAAPLPPMRIVVEVVVTPPLSPLPWLRSPASMTMPEELDVHAPEASHVAVP